MNEMRKASEATGVKNQRGVTIVLVTLLMVVFLGIAALTVDLAHLYAVGNELHNAADAGALAGARFLYNDTGTAVTREPTRLLLLRRRQTGR